MDKLRLIMDEYSIRVDITKEIENIDNNNNKEAVFFLDLHYIPILLNLLSGIEIDRYKKMTEYYVDKWEEMPLEIKQDERDFTLEKVRNTLIRVNSIKEDQIDSTTIQKDLDSAIRLGRAAGVSISI